MQSPPPVSRNPAVVPFSWEEKPGVPKTQESSALEKQESGTLLLSICLPPRSSLLQRAPSPALSAPPYLQRPSLRKTNSFAAISPSPPSSAPAAVLVRKQSFDSRLLYHAGAADGDPRRRSRPGAHKLHGHGTSTEQEVPHEKRRLRRWMEEDPFFMAVEVCRREPLKVSCNERSPPDAPRVRQWEVTGFEHFAMKQQSQEEDECLHHSGAQKQPLIVHKKQPGCLYRFLPKCLVC